MIKIKLVGFDKVEKFLRNLTRDITVAGAVALRELGKEGELMATEHIKRQDLNWTPLSSQYLKRKQQLGLGKKTLIATTSYLNAITHYARLKRVGIGVLKGARNSDGDDLSLIAKVHEYGSKQRNIPARPLWRVVRGELRKYIATRRPFIRAAKRQFRKYGI